MEVSRYDLIFLDQEPRSITYTVTKGYHRISGWVESGCVSMEALAYETVNEDEEYAVSVEITPEKPGADTVTITGSGKACRVTAYVSPDAYPDFHAAVGTDPDRTYEEIRVLDLPWDAAYPQVKGILEGEDLQIGDPVIKNDHIRAVISGEIPFGECTAAVVALDFSYTPGISNYRDNNALFRGVFYFAPDTSTDQIRLAVRNRYNLTNGDWWGNVWTWLRGDVLLTLSCTERYIVLEVEKLSEDMLW